MNTYAYVGGNPVNAVDPTGENPLALAILGAAAVGALVEAGIQLYDNGGRLSCLDFGRIGEAAAIGALFGGGGGLARGVIARALGRGGAAATKSGAKLLETPREALLRNASDPRLKDAINNLYRPGAKVGRGSTADALRSERATGKLLSRKGHTQKLIDRRTQLMKLRRDPNLSAGDRRIIHDLLKDAQDALGK